MNEKNKQSLKLYFSITIIFGMQNFLSFIEKYIYDKNNIVDLI
jgi:hypothetical protein